MKVVISSGHGTKVRGASGFIDEVDEAIRVMDATAAKLRAAGVEVATYTDTVSTSQSENLNRIVDFHESQQRDLDVSVHFNAYQTTEKPMGCEVLYLTQQGLAAAVSAAIATAGGLIDRGAKKRTDLFFLNNTSEPSVLLEVAFVDSTADVALYAEYFDAICTAIAEVISGKDIPDVIEGAEPAEPPQRPAPPPLDVPPPTLGFGDRGSSVAWVQNYLDVRNIDGEYGNATESAVEDYQLRAGLSVDGIVGPMTWAQLNADFDLPVYPPWPLRPLRDAEVRDICDAALHSELAGYYWSERGKAPAGYIQGMAFVYANMVRKLKVGDPVATVTAQADRDDPAHDALSWYADEFKALGLHNNLVGIDTLRHLFVLLIGLGMRESSGRHCCGRDQSAANTQSETCEAGLMQTSWNASACSTDMERLLDEYQAMGANQQDALELFEDDVSCSQTEWACYGTGVGYDYQMLAKRAPAFAVESTALCLRFLRQHWGPINRRDVELRLEADLLLQDIEAIIGDEA
jgi:peptidoglycan hydrolase-like protein with peptidoglycan-binding domain